MANGSNSCGDCSRSSGTYKPTAEEIAAQTELIRQDWSDREYHKRASSAPGFRGIEIREEYEIPEYRVDFVGENVLLTPVEVNR